MGENLWICTQESLLLGLRGLYEVMEIEFGLASGKSLSLYANTLVS